MASIIMSVLNIAIKNIFYISLVLNIVLSIKYPVLFALWCFGTYRRIWVILYHYQEIINTMKDRQDFTNKFILFTHQHFNPNLATVMSRVYLNAIQQIDRL